MSIAEYDYRPRMAEDLSSFLRDERGRKATSWNTICGKFPLRKGLLETVRVLVAKGTLRTLSNTATGMPRYRFVGK
jgi:hypothetical protein